MQSFLIILVHIDRENKSYLPSTNNQFQKYVFKICYLPCLTKCFYLIWTMYCKENMLLEISNQFCVFFKLAHLKNNWFCFILIFSTFVAITLKMIVVYQVRNVIMGSIPKCGNRVVLSSWTILVGNLYQAKYITM